MDMSSSVRPTLGDLISEMEAIALDGLEGAPREKGMALLRELMQDWLREAGDDKDTPVVCRILREDYVQLVEGLPPEARLHVLQGQVLDRRVRALSVRSWSLGTQAVDGTIDAARCRAQGVTLLEEADAILPSLRDLPDRELGARLERDLEEVRLEALYAIERKAMSHRLQRYLLDKQRNRDAPQIIP
jgi:hypothetical protein